MSEGERFVLACLAEGGRAFRRSALSLVSFALLLGGLLALTATARGVLAPLGRLAGAGVALWGGAGLLRGAVAALEGRRAGPGLLLRRDRRDCRRLLLASLLVLGFMGLAASMGYGLVALSSQYAPASDPLTALLVQLLPLLPALVLLGMLPLGPLLVLEEGSVLTAAGRSWRLVARRPGAVLVLATLQLALLGVGDGLHPLLGLGLAVPLALCLSTATARRLSREAGC